jgi:hypothetical protein
MRLTTIGILFTAMVIAVPTAAHPAHLRPQPSARWWPPPLRTVTNEPLYFKVQSIALSSGEKSSVFVH